MSLGIELWRTAAYNPRTIWKVVSIVFVPDNQFIASRDYNETVKLWRVTF